ncbi:hypothetical protein Tco_0246212 [Tanacetum coccineum]
MANIRTCNKHNMIACVEKTEHNADFHQIVDYLTGCSINYSLLVDPDLIGPWLQQFWATASLRSINEVPHIRAMVAGKRVLISEETIRADLLFDDADGVDCFPKQVIWDSLRDIGYEGNLAQLTFSKPLFSPQWKYLVHVLLHCLSPKSTSWEQFGTNIASALVGLATNQKFNFSLMIMNGMLGHIANGKPFLMYPRFIQLFLNKQLEGVTRPQNFLPSVTLPSKVFTFMRKNSPKFSGRITPLTPPMLEVITALAAEEAHSESTHSRAESSPRDAQGTPTQSAAQASILQGTAEAQGAADIPQSPNDYTPTDESQTSGGDEGLLDLYALNREQLKKRGKKQKKKVSSVKLGRNKDEGNLSEENHDQDDHNHTAFVYEDFDATDAIVAVTPDLERKSDETEQDSILLLGQSAVKYFPRTLIFEDEAGLQTKRLKHSWSYAISTSTNHNRSITDPKEKGKGILVEEPKKKKLTLQQIRALETTNDEEVARKVQAEWDAEEERKRLEALKKPKTISKKPTSLAQERTQMMNFLKGQGYKNLQKLRYPQMKELYDKVQESIKNSFKDFIPMGSEKEKQVLQERDAKRLLRKRKATVTEEQPSKKLKLRTETIDELRNYLRIVDFEKSAQDRVQYHGVLITIQFLNQEDWEIVRWRLNESSGVHTLELEDGTMIHMLTERRYPLSRELMIRMLDHGMEVEDESDIAITLIHLFILWTTEDGDDS